MAIVYSCITPHTPLLMPTIGKEKLAGLAGTVAALKQLERDFYVAKPDVVVVVTPHGQTAPNTLTIDLAPRYVGDFSRFGDLATRPSWASDPALAGALREWAKKNKLALTLSTADTLDYGVAVPLSYLTVHLPDVRIVPVMAASELGLKEHFEIGRHMKNVLLGSGRRVAVVASADLSHRAGDEAEGGISPAGVAFDNAIASIVHENNLLGILDLDEATVADAQACGSRVLATVFGMLDDMKHRTNVLCYEKPFGVGYLTAHMRLL